MRGLFDPVNMLALLMQAFISPVLLPACHVVSLRFRNQENLVGSARDVFLTTFFISGKVQISHSPPLRMERYPL